MLNGACCQLYSILASDIRGQFDAELYKILKSDVTKSPMLLLWVCGIVLLTEQKQGQEHPVASPTLRQQWTTPSGQKLFGLTKDMHKTIQLIGLPVLLILRGEVTEDEATEGIQIASRVLKSIDRDVLDSFPTADKDKKGLFEKYPAKLVGSNTSQSVLFEALSFYAVLAGPRNLPREIVALYETSISEIMREGDSSCITETLSVSLPLYEVSAACHRASYIAN
jgi:hypothetical protein